ncbi:MAG TPA: MFS transporter, partial [Ktedonobacterales bacterium]|nr:MFS transporter [Ktedonobacterales bacterium]
EQESAYVALDGNGSAISDVATAGERIEEAHDPYLALHYRDFRLLLAGRFVATMGEQMLNVAIGWELYQRTNSALALGFVGLVQVAPVIALALPAGQIADRFNRKMVIGSAIGMLTLSALGLALLSSTRGPLPLVYVCLLAFGIGDAFYTPASSAFISQVIPATVFGNAATWSSSSWQLAAVLGPALGGFVIAWQHGATTVYVLEAVATVIYLLLLVQIRSRHQPVRTSDQAKGFAALVEGVNFVRSTKVILAAITLDLFAVLFGGATTLLPIFARDILHVGPVGLGWMRALPSIGAVLMAVTLAHLPPFPRAGRTLLLAVAGFGAATIIFGVSRWFPLSLAMLFLLGALDNISVVMRSTLMLVRTPDAMRGRVSAVNSVFVGMSNQLGGFESGVTAAILTPTLSVIGGGIGTIVVVIAVALIWPQIRRLGLLIER